MRSHQTLVPPAACPPVRSFPPVPLAACPPVLSLPRATGSLPASAPPAGRHGRTSRPWHYALLVLTTSLALAATLRGAPPSTQTSVLRPDDRIVIVGDSITGQSVNNSAGFKHVLDWALHEQYPQGKFVLLPLGGSGQTVGSWMNVVKTTREEQTLDVKDVPIKATLDQKADVLLIMLGMNDVLSPSLSDKPADYDAWIARYGQLLTTLRERLKPRIIGLATVTMCTEDPAGPKNRALGEMNRRVAKLAGEQDCLLLPTGQEVQNTLAKGRMYNPDFHVANDMVHPNGVGHAAVAIGMLKGLGETEAARKVDEKYLAPAWKQAAGTFPALSYSVAAQPSPLDSDQVSFQVRYWWTTETPSQTAPTVRLTVPAGWQVSPAQIQAATGTFTVAGRPDHLSNDLTLDASAGAISKQTKLSIPAPWLIATGLKGQPAWPGGKFDATKAHIPLDDTLAKGDGLTKPEVNGQSLTWSRYLATPNYTGGANPASVDMYAVTFTTNFEAAYAARWVYSDHDRPVQLTLASRTFAGSMGLTAWLNGQQLYSAALTDEPKKAATFDSKLTRGWNLLLIRSNHQTWQWQFSVAVTAPAGDDLSDLRISCQPKPPETAP